MQGETVAHRPTRTDACCSSPGKKAREASDPGPELKACFRKEAGIAPGSAEESGTQLHRHRIDEGKLHADGGE